jgi:hypothetical protein
MREFYFTFEGLKGGLRKTRHNPRNLQALVECMNAKPHADRLRPYDPFTLPVYTLAGIPVDLSLEWPFPQLIGGADWNFLVIRDAFADEDRIYTIDAADALTLIAVSDVATYLAWGDRFELADFGPYTLMTNGVIMVYRDVTGPAWITTAVGIADTIPLMGTI